jgi:hypothetical protein
MCRCCAGAIIARSSQVVAVTANTFTCTFPKNSAAYTPAQVRNLAQFGPLSRSLNNSAVAYQLPAKLSSLKDKVRCTYVLYGRTGANVTDSQSCSPRKSPDVPYNCTEAAPFDAPRIQWHFDKDNKPAAGIFTDAAITITCKVNSTLLVRMDTVLVAGPNDGKCFPSWARVITPAGPKLMAQLAVGEKVLAVDAVTGKAVFHDVYLVPHRDADATTTYLNIQASPVGARGSSKVLTLSPRHYVPTACGAEQQRVCLKHAVEVAAGDLLWLVEGGEALLARIDQVGAIAWLSNMLCYAMLL